MSQITELNRRGVELKQQGRYEEAASCYEHALRLQPDFAEARFNLGLLYRDLGDLDRAVECLEQTRQLRPDLPIVQVELAKLYFDQGRWHEAESLYHRLLQKTPEDLLLRAALALVWQQQGRLEQAAAAYREILAADSSIAAAWTNLGHILKAQGNLDEAIRCYKTAISHHPELAEAHSNLGNSWLALGKYDGALAEYSIAAALRPDSPRSHIDLGNAWQRLERFGDAVGAYSRAIELDPNAQDAWLNAIHLLKEVGDFSQASGLCRQLASQQPHDPAHRLRAAAICPLVFDSQDELRAYREELQTTARALEGTDWDFDFERWTVYAPECPYNLQFLDGDLRPLKESFARVFARALEKQSVSSGHRTVDRQRPRIGFVVTAKHERAFLKLLGGVIERLDGRRWDLCILCSQLGANQIRAGLQRRDIQVVAYPERWDLIVSTVARSECDLLYYWEVGNDPTNYFLPFLRLAPVQITSWGIQVTTGIPHVDAYLSSHLVEGPHADEHYSEQLIRASTLLTYQTRPAFSATPKRREQLGLPTVANLYGCVQNLGKFHPEFDLVLAEILRRDKAGVLVVARDSNGFGAERLKSRWQRVMPDVVSRILLLNPLNQADYLQVLHHCDVLLDPLHFGGVTTTYDALALGQPVVTLPNPYHRGRYTAACLRKAGVTETIAKDRADYVEIAIRLAADPPFRRSIREAVRATSSQVFEDREAVTEHERIFEDLLDRCR